MCVAGTASGKPALEQEGVSGVCVKCCAERTCVWDSVGFMPVGSAVVA